MEKLYRSGVDVTINSDDVLIFDSDVSKEYLRLYESQCLTAEELENISKKWTETYNCIDKSLSITRDIERASPFKVLALSKFKSNKLHDNLVQKMNTH
mgnify:CR=1 FL=1